MPRAVQLSFGGFVCAGLPNPSARVPEQTRCDGGHEHVDELETVVPIGPQQLLSQEESTMNDNSQRDPARSLDRNRSRMRIISGSEMRIISGSHEVEQSESRGKTDGSEDGKTMVKPRSGHIAGRDGVRSTAMGVPCYAILSKLHAKAMGIGKGKLVNCVNRPATSRNWKKCGPFRKQTCPGLTVGGGETQQAFSVPSLSWSILVVMFVEWSHASGRIRGKH